MFDMLHVQTVAPPPSALASMARSVVGVRRLRLARPPYAGVRCAGGNSIACDRVGLAVWLIRRPGSLSATIAGHTLVLRPPPLDSPSGSAYWQGSLQPAGLLRPGPMHVTPDSGSYYWAGRHPRAFWVLLTARYPHQPPASVRVRVQLHAGWG